MENLENQNVNFNFNGINGKVDLPDSTTILVLGIISIVVCWCYGLPAIILGIIALVLSSKANKLFKANPLLYTQSSYKNMQAGKVCAIIGLVLGSLYLIFAIMYVIFVGTALSINGIWSEIYHF
jgi:hypothetical protein